MMLDEKILKKLDRSLVLASLEGGVFVRQLVISDLIKPLTKVYIYKEENHKRPHIHVYYGKNEQISLCIESTEVLAGNLNRKLLVKVQEWVKEHKQELLETWSQIQIGSKPELAWVSSAHE